MPPSTRAARMIAAARSSCEHAGNNGECRYGTLSPLHQQKLPAVDEGLRAHLCTNQRAAALVDAFAASIGTAARQHDSPVAHQRRGEFVPVREASCCAAAVYHRLHPSPVVRLLLRGGRRTEQREHPQHRRPHPHAAPPSAPAQHRSSKQQPPPPPPPPQQPQQPQQHGLPGP
eukprot:COSAG02_NODE_1340_length_13187_cov_6.960804_2_plen_173_part_00